MRLILVQPPVEDFYDTPVRLMPLGLSSLKASLKKSCPDISVTIKDYHQGYGRQTLSWPKEFKYLKAFYGHPDQSPFCSFHHYYRFGAREEFIVEDLLKDPPDVIGVSALFTPYFRETLSLIVAIKKKAPQITIVVGGPHVSAVPEHLLNHPEIDYVIRGEGEIALGELLEYLQGKRTLNEVSNVAYRDKETKKLIFHPIKTINSLDELPFPDFSDFKLEDYSYEGRPLCFMMTSRSCPHHCDFCSVHQTFGNKYRRRSTNSIIEEIKLRYEEGYRVIDFEDDNLTFHKKEMKDLCQKLIALFPHKEMTFLAMNGISYKSLDPELLTLMREANFTHLNLALVSTNNHTKKTLNRPHDLSDYFSIVHHANALGFQMVSYQIVGLPYETIDQMIETLCTNALLPVLLGCSSFYLTPNTPIATYYKDLLDDDSSFFKSRLTSFYPSHPLHSGEEIYTLFITTRIINFIKDRSCKKEETARDKIGETLLQKLFSEKKLYTYYKGVFQVQNSFKYFIFEKIVQKLPKVFQDYTR